MNELIELFKEFDVENIWMLLVVSVVLICMATSYIQLFHASKIETVLMNRNEETKRFFFVYVIIFFMFCITNYILTMSVESFVLSIGILAVTKVSSFLLKFAKKGKLRKLYWWLEERKDIYIALTTTAIYTFVAPSLLKISRISCVVLGALVAVFVVAIAFLNIGKVRSTITVTIDDKKWYVFKRLDEKYLLCGDRSSIEDSTKTKLLGIEDIIEQNIFFSNENLKD